MPLTNAAWQKNFRLQAATTGGNPIPLGDKGVHIEILRKNLESVGFERSLEPVDYFGASTNGMIRDFREIYGLAGKKDVADKAVLETLDGILNGKITKKSFKTPNLPAVGAKGKDFAVKYIKTTREWVDNALKACRFVQQSLNGLFVINTIGDPSDHLPGQIVPTSSFGAPTYLPFLHHFRLIICPEAASDVMMNKLDKNLLLFFHDWNKDSIVRTNINVENMKQLLTKINRITAVFNDIRKFLAKDTDEIFKNDATNTQDLAWWPIGSEELVFGEKLFVEISTATPKGKDSKSASWITVHEACHAILRDLSLHGSGTGPGDNPYSYHAGYYQMDWKQAVNNPDSYAHFAYQISAGKQNLGPWA